MSHIKLKASKQMAINFHPKELDSIDIPDESKKIVNEYHKSGKLADESDYDILVMFPDTVAYGFDYHYKNTKRVIVEINPVTIFYSNAVMSFGNLEHYKEILISQSKDISKWNEKSEPVNLTHSGMFFQLSINCIINLQATLESFANRVIPTDYQFINKQGNAIAPSISHKVFSVLPKLKQIDFGTRTNRKHKIAIEKLIQQRNNIIHLKPTGTTNTGYKGVYRDLLGFDFAKALEAVKTFINFYEPNLLEECECGNNLYFYYGQPLNKANP